MWSHEYSKHDYVARTRWQPCHKDVLWCLQFLLMWLPTSWRHHVASTLNFWKLHSCGTWTHVMETIGSSEIWVLYVLNCISSHPKRLYLCPHHCENPVFMLDSCLLCFGTWKCYWCLIATDVQRFVCVIGVNPVSATVYLRF